LSEHSLRACQDRERRSANASRDRNASGSGERGPVTW
jgi:hypothetical protein